MARDNKEIGRFDLTDIPPAPRGVPQIEVCFDIDANGILHVSARDVQTKKEQKIRIEAKSGLNEEEIKRMLKDAELNAEEDKQRKEEAEARNEADSTAFRAQKSLDEYKAKLPAQVVEEIQSKIDATKNALKGTDTAAIKRASDELNRSMQKIGENMQQQPGASAAGPNPQASAGGPSQKSEKPDIEEADVEILDDEKK